MELLIATRNPGKEREYRQLLAMPGLTLRFPAELGLQADVPEDGTTYAANAIQKALTYSRLSGLITLADDSGLEVDALGGAPGVHSARYAPGDDRDRVTLLLEQLRDVPWERRTARFRCVIVVVTPDGVQGRSEGICEGRIALAPVGEHGFGYDPVFYPEEYGCTLAQLSEEEKNRISHRGKAVAGIRPFLSRQVRAQEALFRQGAP